MNKFEKRLLALYVKKYGHIDFPSEVYKETMGFAVFRLQVAFWRVLKPIARPLVRFVENQFKSAKA